MGGISRPWAAGSPSDRPVWIGFQNYGYLPNQPKYDMLLSLSLSLSLSPLTPLFGFLVESEFNSIRIWTLKVVAYKIQGRVC